LHGNLLTTSKSVGGVARDSMTEVAVRE
jgi:hypothetical protein